jgi:hypothetical protein
MSYDDEILMAYADGELDAAQRAEIEAAMMQDPELARRVQHHRALRAQVATVFAPVLEQPVPAQLEAAARGIAKAQPQQRGKVVQFPARAARAPATPWRAREWTAMAASLVLGVFLSWRFLAPSSSADLVASNGALVARGALAAALDSQLASEQAGDRAVLIGLSFKASDGNYCRSFMVRESATAGLACHEDGDWRIPVTNAVEVQSGEIRRAASLPPAVVQAIESRLEGEPLDAAAEKAARDANWGAR